MTANRRLGAEFLFLDELFRGENSENFAILDLIVLAEWLHENIGSFGGDTSNHFFGHGEGGARSAMTSAPASKGSFVE